MSAVQHTPGPWEVAGGYVRTRFDGRNGGFSIARVEALNDEHDANAALLAAAPDLLAELRDFHDHAIDQGWHDCIGIPGGCHVATAIRKAGGAA